MTYDQWWATLETREQQRADKELTREAFAAGAASRDAEVAELVAALKPFGAIDLVESRLPAEFAMLILSARAAIASTPEQSLDEYRNKVIEDCAKQCEAPNEYGFHRTGYESAEAIRAMKEQP